MPRKQTRTVRVDLRTHEDLTLLAERYAGILKQHVSIADAVRMGVSLLALNAERRIAARDAESQREAT